jgi:hypothetical protein
MHLIDLILKAITFGTLLVGAVALYIAVRNNSRQLAAQIFLAYSDRVREIRSAAAYDINKPEAILAVTYLIFEFHSPRRRGYVPKPIWEIWEADITNLLNTPSFLELWPTIRRHFESHRHFLIWVAERHRTQHTTQDDGRV